MRVALSNLVLAADSEKLINLYHNGFIVCIILAILFFVAAIVMFFVFDIRNIFNIKTGRAQKRKIDEMEKENSLTGRFIAPNSKKKKSGLTGEFSGKLNKIKNDLTSRKEANKPQEEFSAKEYYEKQEYPEQAYKPKALVEPPAAADKEAPKAVQNEEIKVDELANEKPETTVLSAAQADINGVQETSVLSETPVDDYGVQETSVLSETPVDNYGAQETSVLSETPVDNYGAQETSVLSETPVDDYGVQETSVLSAAPAAAQTAQSASVENTDIGDYAPVYSGFKITKNIVLIHTQEIIDI